MWRWMTRRSFTKAFRLCSCYPCTDASKLLKQTQNVECSAIFVFEDLKANNRLRIKRDIEIWTNACFLGLNHAERLTSIEQSMKSKASKLIFSQNKAGLLLDHPGKFPHSLLIPVAINTLQWNCCLDNMANVPHLMDNTEYANFFRMTIIGYWWCFHQKQIQHYRKHYNILSFRKLTFDVLKVVVKELQLLLLLVSTDI